MKSVFITGGTSGIGAELARQYLADGYRVGVCGRSWERFNKFLGEKENLHFYELDTCNRAESKRVIREFAQDHSLDIVYANAGRSVGSKNKTPDFDKFEQVISVNLQGAVNTFEAAFLIMKEQGHGHIIGISSVAGFCGFPGASAYNAAKGGLIKFCESIALDWKKFNIDVSCVCPGFIRTPLTDLNDHSMPFMLEADVACRRIKKAMDKKKVFYSLPKRMYFMTRFLEIIPRCMYRKMMTLKIINYSKEQ